MTSAEVTAYNLGVRAVLDAARRSAEDLSRAAATWKPTRVAFAIAALDEFAAAGESLLIPGRNEPGTGVGENPSSIPPQGPSGQSGAAATAQAAYVERIPSGDDGNFGLSDAEIARPSRETIVNWLAGRTPMLASHWSRIAADMILKDALTKLVAAQ